MQGWVDYEIETAMGDLKTALESEETSAEDIQSKTSVLMTASMKLGEMVYKKQQEEEAANGESETADAEAEPSSDTPDDVVDADFTEVNDKDDKDEDAKSA